jgi:Mrp family chromosome partitioning ATPase
MKTRDLRTGRLNVVSQTEDEVVMGSEVIANQEQADITNDALAVRFIASLVPTDGAVTPKKTRTLSKHESGSIARLQEQFLHASLPLFFDEHDPLHALGITSAVAGEGKTMAALLVSHALATSSRRPVMLVECDWDHSTLSRDLNLPTSPGLAEWLRGTSDRLEIRHQVMPNLTVVPAGLGGADAMTSLAELHRPELRERLADPDEIIILDLPSVLGSYYGKLAARLAEALLLVVRAGSTPASFVARACDELKDMRVEGVVLNQVQTRIPRWLQGIL